MNMTTDTTTSTDELAFSFLRASHRPSKPRTRGITEIRGPYYTVMGPRYLKDVLETMGAHVDALKFAGGSFTLMPERALREILDTAHEHDVLVSTGGFIEHVLTQGPQAVDRYIDEVARLGFDILEISSGFISIPTDDILRLVERVQRAGLKAKPEVGIQFGAGGATTPQELAQEGTRDVGYAIDLAQRCMDAGAYMIMIESEGITEEVTTLADGRGREDRPRARPSEGDVRGRRPRGVRVVCQELRPRGQPVRRPLADRPARVPAPRDLGHQEPVGPGRDIPGCLTMALDVQTKRVYEPADPADGYRVLIDHVWPRGVSKDRARLDEWARELAPSDELRKWFDHVPEHFDEFRHRYRRELSGHAELIDKLRDRARQGRLTIVYAARDEEHNNAVVLVELVRDG